MKNLGVVGINYGNLYQSFIPFFIYSALKYQSNCSVLIFSDNKMQPKVKTMLSLLSGLGDYEVIESYDFGLKDRRLSTLIPEYRRAMRWLFFDERFLEFETLYFGDIDILFSEEGNGIYEQHLKHCTKLQLPYSNYIRASYMKNTLKRLLYILLKNGISNYQRLLFYTKNRILPQNKFSGLHFVKNPQYFEYIIPHFQFFHNLITSQNQDIRLLNNEAILYELIKRSKIGLPPICSTSPDLDNTHTNYIGFRPHHGIHLGIFRENNSIVFDRQVVESYVYQDYLQNYQANYQNDDLFIRLLKLSSPFVQKVFNNLDNYLHTINVDKK